jgi:ElaB/YqjD/DUF883 family membrane-anchored ribosome-binding protein
MKLVFDGFGKVVSMLRSLQVKLAFATLIGFLILTNYVLGFSLSANADELYDKQNKGQPEPYDMVQPRQVGANNYNDDPKYDTGRVDDDAQRLINRAERNLQQKAQNPGDLVENAQRQNPIGEKARESSQRLQEGADEIKKGFYEGRRRGMRNIKENVEQAKREVPRVVDEAKDNAADATRGARETARDASGGLRGFFNRRASNAVNK